MPANNPAGWAFAFRRKWTDHLFPDLERTPELSRGEQRLAAEVALSVLRCQDVPSFARERAFVILDIMARG